MVAGPGYTSAKTIYDYTAPGHTKVTDPLNHPPVDYTVDGMGRVTASLDSKGATTATVWTADSKVDSFTSALGGLTHNTWGANGGDSLTTVQTPTGVQMQTTYADAAHPYLPTGAQDGTGQWTMSSYNSAPGNRDAMWNAVTSAKSAVSYNADGTIATFTDPDNITPPPAPQDYTKSTRYEYFANHLLKKVTPPDVTPVNGSAAPGAQTLTYDGFGRLKTATSGKGVTTTYNYDKLDRVTSESHSDATTTVSYLYDAHGNVYRRTDASGTTSYDYDAANRLLSKALPGGGGTLTYVYDAASNLSTATGAGGTTAYHYDKLNRLDQVTEPLPNQRKDVFAYNAAGQRVDAWYNTGADVAYDASGNNVVPPGSFALHTKATYDVAGQLTCLRTTRAGSDTDPARVLSDLLYAYNVPGSANCSGSVGGTVTTKRQAVTDQVTGKTTTYSYDAMGRLTQAATSGGPTYTYGYSPSSNRTSDSSGAHTFNAASQLTDSGYVYDADGNLTGSPVRSALYNGIGQTTSVTPTGGAQAPFGYSGSSQGERTAAGGTVFRNGLLGIDAEVTGGATTAYVRDSTGGLISERTPGGDFYYYSDGMGSVIGLVDASGTPRAAYTYDPYGSNATATALNGTLPSNPWRFAGGYLDAATGLYHFGARYYDPATGRWTQPDPVAGGCNAYDYVCGDPVNNIDPSGTKNVGFDRNDEKIAGIVDDCLNGTDPEYSGSAFCHNFVDGYINGDLTAFGFGFVADGSGKCPGWLKTIAGKVGEGDFARAALAIRRGDPEAALDYLKRQFPSFVISEDLSQQAKRAGSFVGKFFVAVVSAGATAIDAACSINP